MEKPKILVTGSLVMDLIIETEIFPSSGETVVGKSFQTAPGGKGANQAVQAARLGAEVTMVGKVGNDDFGKVLLQSLSASGVNTKYIYKSNTVSTAVGNILLEVGEGKSTQNRIIVVPGANMSITNNEISFLESEIKNYDMVILQLEIPMEINELVAEIAYKNNVPIMLNSAPAMPLSDTLLSKLTYIAPNEHEAFLITGVKIKQDGNKVNLDDVKSAAKVLVNRGVKNVIITLGDKGTALMNDREFVYLECFNAGRAVDPTAAGDSFVGAFCYSICIEKTCSEALKFANKTAAITVTKKGAQPSLPTMGEIEEIRK